MGWLTKTLLIYLFIALATTMYNPQLIFNGDSPSDATVLSWLNIRVNTTTNQVYYLNNQLNGSASTSFSAMQNSPNIAGTGNSIITYADPILMILGWFGTIAKFAFSPLIILSTGFTDAPTPVLLMIAIPLVVMFIWGIVQFIRGVVW